MSRIHLVKRLAEFTQRPWDAPLALPAPASPAAATPATAHALPTHRRSAKRTAPDLGTSTALTTCPPTTTQDLYVWFEDTSSRVHSSRRGIAGLPESLLPYARGLRVIERHYAEGHLHLLSAARLRCSEQFGERISALYTAALSVGTVAWIGTGAQYARAWQEMYPS